MKEQLNPRVLLTHFDWNIRRLEESLVKEPTEYYKGASIQRFGYTYEIALKLIRTCAAEQKVTCSSDGECFAYAAANQWIPQENNCGEIMESYRKAQLRLEGKEADEIYHRLQPYYQMFKDLYLTLEKSISVS